MISRQRSCCRDQKIVECTENRSRRWIPPGMLHLSGALYLISLRVSFVVSLGFVVVLAALARIVSFRACIVGPKRKIHAMNSLGLRELLEATRREPSARKPVSELSAGLLLGNAKRQQTTGSQNRIS